jgi:hypothetical protein
VSNWESANRLSGGLWLALSFPQIFQQRGRGNGLPFLVQSSLRFVWKFSRNASDLSAQRGAIGKLSVSNQETRQRASWTLRREPARGGVASLFGELEADRAAVPVAGSEGL